MAAQTAGAHSSGSAGPRAMPRAVGAGRGAGAARGAGSHHPSRPRVRGLSSGRFARWSLSRNSWSPPLRARRGRGRTAGLGDAGWAVRPLGRARGADRGRAGGRVPARPPRWAERGPAGAPCRRDAPAAGVARGKLGARTRGAARPGTCLPLPPSGLRLGPPGRKGGAWDVQPHPRAGCGGPGTWSEGSRSGRRCAPPAPPEAAQSQHPAARAPPKRGLGDGKGPRKWRSRRRPWGPPCPSRKLRNGCGGAAWRGPGSAMPAEATAAFGSLLKADCVILLIKGRTLFSAEPQNMQK